MYILIDIYRTLMISRVFIKVHRCFCWVSNIINDKDLLFKSLPRASLKVLLIILNIPMGIWALCSATWKMLMSTVIIKLITERLQAVAFVILSYTDTVWILRWSQSLCVKLFIFLTKNVLQSWNNSTHWACRVNKFFFYLCRLHTSSLFCCIVAKCTFNNWQFPFCFPNKTSL